MSSTQGAAGLTALSICESILLSLTDNGIIAATEAKVILEDAAIAHRKAVDLSTDDAPHAEAAELIEGIIRGGNAVRRH